MLKQKWRKEASIDVVNLVLGLGLIIMPWAFKYTSVEVATRNAWIAGALMAATAVVAIVAFAEWEEWLNLLLGLWVAISPWALGFDILISKAAASTQVALGLIVAVLAAVEVWMVHNGPPRRMA